MSLEVILAEGKLNSLGRVQEVIDAVLADQTRLPELFECLFSNNSWVRLRAADALEKIARQQPAWLQPYTNRLLNEISTIAQAGVQWHLAQILGEIDLDANQKTKLLKFFRILLKIPKLIGLWPAIAWKPWLSLRKQILD